MNFQKHEYQPTGRAVRGRRILMSIVVLTMLPAAYMTIRIVQQSIFDNNVRKFVKAELTQRGTQIISSTVDNDSLRLRVVAVGREISSSTQAEAQRRMKDYGLEDYALRVIQGTQSDSLLALSHQLTSLTTSRETEHSQLLQLTAENTHLNQQLYEYKRYEALAAEIRPELASLFPQVSKFALQRVAEVSRDSADVRHYVTAIIEPDGKHPLSKEETRKLHDWLLARIKADSLIVIQRHRERSER
jgi:cell division protein FtsB